MTTTQDQTVALAADIVIAFVSHNVTSIYELADLISETHGALVKHVRHALRWLKPDGVLVSILPASARYDHGELDGTWQDLPVASFADAGTNVPTTMLKMRAA